MSTLTIQQSQRRKSVPAILWLLGVPLTLVLVLMLTGIVHF
jgi:hypothetical protein